MNTLNNVWPDDDGDAEDECSEVLTCIGLMSTPTMLTMRITIRIAVMMRKSMIMAMPIVMLIRQRR